MFFTQLNPGTILFIFGIMAVFAVFFQTYFRRGFSVLMKCCKKAEDSVVYDDDQVFRNAKG